MDSARLFNRFSYLEFRALIYLLLEHEKGLVPIYG